MTTRTLSTEEAIEKAARTLYEIDYPPAPHMPGWSDKISGAKRDIYVYRARAAIIAWETHRAVSEAELDAATEAPRGTSPITNMLTAASEARCKEIESNG